MNCVTVTPNSDGSVTVTFGPEPDGSDDFLHVMDGWNYAARMYRPRPAILDGHWVFPEPEPTWRDAALTYRAKSMRSSFSASARSG